jgi:hypothetical protein
MKLIFKTLVLACLVALVSTSANATCERVVQNGTVINGAPVVFITECLIARAGGSAGSTIANGLPMITDLGVMGPFGIIDAPITGAYHKGVFSWQGNNLVLALNGLGGAGVPGLCLSINGGQLISLGGSSCGGGGGGGDALLIQTGSKLLIQTGSVLLIQ